MQSETFHPRNRLAEARRVAARPSLHSAQEVFDACQLMITFGHSDDFVQANDLRARISRGEVVPGAWWSRMHRRIRWASLLCLIIWIIVGLLHAYSGAAEAGFLSGGQSQSIEVMEDRR